jgi:transcriptional regulator of arginine metabolism
MKKSRQEKIRQIIEARRIATQQELAEALSGRGIRATQSSVSRDIVEMGLIKVNGYYAAPRPALAPEGPVVDVETAGDNLIVVKTEVGLAQPAALTIDRAKIEEIVGTVAGDDTILVAVKDGAAQRAAIRRIIELFAIAPRGNSNEARSRPGGRQLLK